MAKQKNEIINVQGVAIRVLKVDQEDYISLTDMAGYRTSFENRFTIVNWMRNIGTIEFLGLWEELHNPSLNRVGFDTVKSESGRNNFILTPKRWIESTNAIGIKSRAGRYGGGTFAHRHIAFEFGTWLSPAFKLYLIHEFERLKAEEQQHLSLEWNLQRTLAKINYRIHTDAIKDQIIPLEVTRSQAEAI